jgi:hypothetical protein
MNFPNFLSLRTYRILSPNIYRSTLYYRTVKGYSSSGPEARFILQFLHI